jgi:hypothetical protein
MMRLSLWCLLLAAALPAATNAKDQRKLAPPPAGKAVVYIGKMNAFVGAAAPYHFFADDRYIARVKGQTYVRLFMEPGQHVFWVSMMERRTFVKATLEAGHSYALYAKMMAYAEIFPITRESVDWKEFGAMITEDKPLVVPQEDIEEWQRGQPNYIQKALAEWSAAGEPALKLKADEYIDD